MAYFLWGFLLGWLTFPTYYIITKIAKNARQQPDNDTSIEP